MIQFLRKPLRAGLVLLAGATALSCGDDGDPSGPSSGDGIISGTVASQKTGIGVPNLVVALGQEGLILEAAPTDSEGRFSFEGAGPGVYTVALTGLELSGLSALHTAFDPVEHSVTITSEPVELAFAVVGLVPPRIVGEVTCGGATVEGARLRVIGGQTDVTVVTNEIGRYAATDLAPGNYAVIALEAPCTLSTLFRAVELLPGQGIDIDFQG